MLQLTLKETRNASQNISFPRVPFSQISREKTSSLDYSPSVTQIGHGIATKQDRHILKRENKKVSKIQ